MRVRIEQRNGLGSASIAAIPPMCVGGDDRMHVFIVFARHRCIRKGGAFDETLIKAKGRRGFVKKSIKGNQTVPQPFQELKRTIMIVCR